LGKSFNGKKRFPKERSSERTVKAQVNDFVSEGKIGQKGNIGGRKKKGGSKETFLEKGGGGKKCPN